MASEVYLHLSMDAPVSPVAIEFPDMTISTEPIGSIPRSATLLQALSDSQAQKTGCSPFSHDTSTARDRAFAKIRARVEGTELAARELGAAR